MKLKDNFFGLIISKNGKTLDQWNFNGEFILTPKPITATIGNDSLRVVYFFVFKDNKIYLNCLNPFENKFITKNKFVVNFIPVKKNLERAIYPNIIFDSNNDGIKELYFSTKASYSKQPRKVFKYDPVTDSITMSCESYASIAASMIADTSGNELNLISASNAWGNSNFKDPYSDRFAWLMDFNSDLSFKYKPFKIGFYPSRSHIISLNVKGEKYLVYLNLYVGLKNYSSTLALLDSNLEIIRENKFKFAPEWNDASLISNNEQSNYFYIVKTIGEVDKINSSLNVERRTNFPSLYSSQFYSEDIDGDKQDELIFTNKDFNKLIIARNDFSNYVEVNWNGANYIKTCSIKLNGSKPRELVLTSDKEILTLQYGFNYLYYLKYPFYLGIYFIVLLLIILIEKSQKHRAELKFKSERKIAELQLKSIKNQIDPHFTLSIINSIGSLFYKQDREKADYVFGKYSKLLRLTILNSDKIVATLEEELDYVKNYLDLEKFRTGNKFCYEINEEENVNKNIKIPKMLIHAFVENAIKHGLRHLEGNGKLIISIAPNSKDYLITISDNGIGRKKAKDIEINNTGKGMQILDQILDLYYNIMKVRITYAVKDLVAENENPLGTEVTINVPVDISNEN